jgi:hypothetical protein
MDMVTERNILYSPYCFNYCLDIKILGGIHNINHHASSSVEDFCCKFVCSVCCGVHYTIYHNIGLVWQRHVQNRAE